MGSTHLVGHRVLEISFKENRVKCDCGVVMKPETTDTPEIDNEQLANEFGNHRKAEMVKLGLPPSR